MQDLDRLLVASCPTVTVPKFGALDPIDCNTHRLLVANDGLWIEVKRTWLTLKWPVANVECIAIPYGSVQKTIEFAFDKIPTALSEQFIREARERMPNEHAAWIVWDHTSGQLEYRSLEIISDSKNAITFKRPLLEDECELCVDLHSHGDSPAYFSTQDNFDDRGECKISAVFGNLNDDDPTWCARLCARGLFINLAESSRWSQRNA